MHVWRWVPEGHRDRLRCRPLMLGLDPIRPTTTYLLFITVLLLSCAPRSAARRACKPQLFLCVAPVGAVSRTGENPQACDAHRTVICTFGDAVGRRARSRRRFVSNAALAASGRPPSSYACACSHTPTWPRVVLPDTAKPGLKRSWRLQMERLNGQKVISLGHLAGASHDGRPRSGIM